MIPSPQPSARKCATNRLAAIDCFMIIFYSFLLARGTTFVGTLLSVTKHWTFRLYTLWQSVSESEREKRKKCPKMEIAFQLLTAACEWANHRGKMWIYWPSTHTQAQNKNNIKFKRRQWTQNFDGRAKLFGLERSRKEGESVLSLFEFTLSC